MEETTTRHITDIESILETLPAAKRERFEQIYQVSSTTGRLKAPAGLHGWITRRFGSVDAVETQQIVKITNLITLEGTLYGRLRANRPMPDRDRGELKADIETSLGDHFCNPEEQTPEDVFGRIRGAHCITASNMAKADGFHGLVIFNEHNPLKFTEDTVRDYFEVALKWAKAAHNVDVDARYFFLWWNCLWNSGASIIHGHAQMTLSRAMHYPKIENWRRSALLYRLGHGRNYFSDLIDVHTALGLEQSVGGAHILVNLAPTKEKELLVVSERPDSDFLRAVYLALDTLVNRLGVVSFSLAFYWPPIDSVAEDWSGFPTIVRIVDRGDIYNRTADMGSAELFAISVVSSDPFHVARVLRENVV
jgi:hypothetical protein